MQQKNYYDIIIETLTDAEKENGKRFLAENVEKFNSGEITLKPQEFEILGAISYLHGVAFTTQMGEMNKEAMSNFQMRIKSCEISNEELENFKQLITTINVSKLFDANERQQQLITQNANINVKDVIKKFKDILALATFPISFSEDIGRLENLEEISYSDLLKINQFCYEDLNLGGSGLKYITEMLSLENVASELQKASLYFDLQKFSLVSYDSILTLREYFEQSQEIFDTYITVDVDSLRSIKDIDAEFLTNNPQIVEEIKEVPIDTVRIDASETDAFLLSVLSEVFVENEIKKINNCTDVISAFDEIYKNENLLPNVYKFLRASIDVNRKNLQEVYGFDCSGVIAEYRKRYDALRADYKETMEQYHQDLEPNVMNEIVELVDETIQAIIIEGAEKKSYLLQQLTENQILTYKHLHQILGLIETCDILGSEYTTYVDLVTYLKKNTTINKIFSLVDDVELKQMNINYNKAILDFYTKNAQ